MRAMNTIHHDKDIVLNKADAIETKWQKINRSGKNGGESANKVDSWLHLVRDVLTQSRTSLNTIGEEEKRSSLPWRNRLSRASSVEAVSNDDVKLKSLPKRASYGGTSSLNIINDTEEEGDIEVAADLDRDTGSDKNNVENFANVLVELRQKRPKSAIRPESDTVHISIPGDSLRPHSGIAARISEDDARANSIESQSDISDQSEAGSTSRAPSVSFSNNHEYITNYREAGVRSVSAPDDVFIDES